ncbi:MAG: metal-dependent hydrolase [Chloroflexota bacterium]
MPRREDEYWLAQHPPACTCVACAEKRLRRLGIRRGPPGRWETLARQLAWPLGMAAFFAALSFAFSLLGLTSGPTPQSSRSGLEAGRLAFEIGGHFVFGFAVGAATRQLRYALLAGAVAVAVDVDHVLWFLGTQADPRASHALLFLLASAALVGLAAARDARQRLLTGVVIAGAVASHLAFDALLGDGKFPLLAPFSFSLVTLPPWAGAALEGAAFVAVLAVAQTLRSRPAWPRH